MGRRCRAFSDYAMDVESGYGRRPGRSIALLHVMVSHSQVGVRRVDGRGDLGLGGGGSGKSKNPAAIDLA